MCTRSIVITLLSVGLSACAYGTTVPNGGSKQEDGAVLMEAPPDAAGFDAAPATADGGVEDAALDGDAEDADVEVPPDVTPDAAPEADCVPRAETCNGIDDDCNGFIDDGVTTCPCAVVVGSDSSYLFCDAPRTWAGARLFCQLHGYDLVVVDDVVEDAMLFATLDGLAFGDSWIGGNDLLVEGAWVWRDGVPMIYANWDEGEPNDGGEGDEDGEDCAVLMTREGRESFWDDRSCNTERAYACEANAPAP